MSLWNYRGRVSRVIDGDTIEMDFLDQGFGDFKFSIPEGKLRFRLAGINAYGKTMREAKTQEEKAKGIEAMHWLADLVEGKTIRLRSVRGGAKGSFSRFLGYIYEDADDDVTLMPETSINRTLLDKGFAVVSKYPDGEVFIEMGYEREEE